MTTVVHHKIHLPISLFNKQLYPSIYAISIPAYSGQGGAGAYPSVQWAGKHPEQAANLSQGRQLYIYNKPGPPINLWITAKVAGRQTHKPQIKLTSIWLVLISLPDCSSHSIPCEIQHAEVYYYYVFT